MKLLSWMNRKSKPDSTEPRKIFSFGNSCSCLAVPPLFDEQLYQSEPRYASANSKQAKKEYSSYSAGLVASKDEEVYKEEADFEMSALFHGFLTIGTLGLEPNISEPTTPKFPKNVTEKETEVTETELMLINDELEKFLQAEANDVSYDSSKRSSFVSTITLSNFETEGTDAKENQNMVICPLQSYLFSSSIELLETGVEGSVEKPFKNSYKTLGGQQEEGKPSKGTCAREFMKKMLKKIRVSSRSSKDSANGPAACTVSTKRKLPKALQMLQRKIHPETSSADQILNKPHKYKDRTRHGDTTGVTILQKDNHKFSEMSMLKEHATTISIHNDSHSTGNGEHWIKSDANYVVLEL